MARLEGIVNLRGREIFLDKIENPVLARVLGDRLRGNKFNFHSEGYVEHKDANYNDTHHDSHRDNYTESHRDNHIDRNDENFYPEYDVHTEYFETHTDRGYSETRNGGYSEHTDYRG